MDLPASEISYRPLTTSAEAAPLPPAVHAPSRDQFGRLLLLTSDALPTDRADQKAGGRRELPVPKPIEPLHSARRTIDRLRTGSRADSPWAPEEGSRESRRPDTQRSERDEPLEPLAESHQPSERAKASERSESDRGQGATSSTDTQETAATQEGAESEREESPSSGGETTKSASPDAAAESAAGQQQTGPQSQPAQGSPETLLDVTDGIEDGAARPAAVAVAGNASHAADGSAGEASTPSSAPAETTESAVESTDLARSTPTTGEAELANASGRHGDGAGQQTTLATAAEGSGGAGADIALGNDSQPLKGSAATGSESAQEEAASTAEQDAQAPARDAGGNAQRAVASSPAAIGLAQALQAAADASTAEESQTDRSAEGTSRPSDVAGLLARMQQRAAGRTAGPQHTAPQNGPQIDPARFVSRVVQAFRIAQERGGVLQLRLSPPELGSLRLELSLQNGAVSATVEAETAHARNALLDNLPVLRVRLAQLDIRVERFDVDLLRQGSQEQPGQQTFDRDGQPPPPEGGPPTRESVLETADAGAILGPAGELGPAGINYII